MVLIRFNKVTTALLLIACLLVSKTIIGQSDKLPELPKEYQSLIESKPLISNVFDVHLIESNGTQKLVYFSKGELTDKKRESPFFLHLHLLNENKTDQNGKPIKFINKDFKGEVKSYFFKGAEYHIAFKEISAFIYSKIETGQWNYKGDKTISWSTVLEVTPNMKFLKPLVVKDADKINDVIRIEITMDNFKILGRKRNEALKRGVLMTEKADYVPVVFKSNTTENMSGSIRLKGDWTDHLKDDEKWSFRVKLKGKNTYLGMRKFSLQHPKTRNYIYEWVAHKILKENGLITLRYKFVHVYLDKVEADKVTSVYFGIFAMEEAFDQLVLDNNERKGDLILKLNEDKLWQERMYSKEVGNWWEYVDNEHRNAGAVTFFSEQRNLEDPTKREQMELAMNLMEGYIEKTLNAHEVFNIDQIAKFTALCNLLGGSHALIWHNLRFYYNSATSRLEPIGFDIEAGERFKRVHNFYNSKNEFEYDKAFAKALLKYSSPEYLKRLNSYILKDLRPMINQFNEIYSKSTFEPSIFEHNAKVMRKYLKTQSNIAVNFEYANSKQIVLRIKNYSKMAHEILRLKVKNTDIHINLKDTSRFIRGYQSKNIVFMLSGEFINHFKSNSSGFEISKDYSAIEVVGSIAGISKETKANVRPFSRFTDAIKLDQIIRKPGNVETFDFLYVDKKAMTITFQSGNRILNKDLIIPEGFTVIANEGLNLDFQNKAQIVSYSALKFNGSRHKPIKFFSSDGSGRGIAIISAKNPSTLSWVHVDNLSNPSDRGWNVPGALSFYESDLTVNNLIIENSRGVQAMSIVRSEVEINGLKIADSKLNAFRADFITGQISRLEISDAKENGALFNGGDVTINKVNVKRVGERGIAFIRKSIAQMSDISIIDSDIGIFAIDGSKVTINEVALEKARVGFIAAKVLTQHGNTNLVLSDIEMSNVGTDFINDAESSIVHDGIANESVQNAKEIIYMKKQPKKGNR